MERKIIHIIYACIGISIGLSIQLGLIQYNIKKSLDKLDNLEHICYEVKDYRK